MPQESPYAVDRPSPIDTDLIKKIILVDRVRREQPVAYRSSSLPGHLIHLIISGEVEQSWSAHTQVLKAGDLAWYHEDEMAAGQIISAPWEFYTVNFLAPGLSPPPFTARVSRADSECHRLFESLLATWQDVETPPIRRQLRSHACLLQLLAHVIPDQNAHFMADCNTESWWRVESILRRDLSVPLNLKALEEISGSSARTLNRACLRATGVSPMRRVKQIRLSYAKGLLLYSQRTISEIAYAVAYSRPQEFSRDFHREYGLTPTEERRSGPDYRTLEH
jgi:AraC-like DNA-binding protein